MRPKSNFIPKSLQLKANGLHARLIYERNEPISLIVCIHGGGCNGRYFDLPSFSFAKVAVEAGHAVLAVDRPGYGGSTAIADIAPVRKAAKLLPELVDKAIAILHANKLPIAFFGHSIGGAVALHSVARSPGIASCVVTSGIGVQPTDEAVTWYAGLGQSEVRLPHQFFFGPEGSFDWRAPMAIRKSAEPWCKAEVDEILLEWPHQFETVAAGISAPTLCILSQNERIWETNDAAISKMRCGFKAGFVKVDIAAGGGHLYEVHQHWLMHANKVITFIEENIK